VICPASKRACQAGCNDTCRYLEYLDTFMKSPNLGLATTRQLLEEIRDRGEVSATIGQLPMESTWMMRRANGMLNVLPPRLLDYRTVDGR